MLAKKKAQANAFAREVAPIIKEAQATGAKTLQAIGAALDARCVRTPQGKRWQPQSVKNVLRRLEVQ